MNPAAWVATHFRKNISEIVQQVVGANNFGFFQKHGLPRGRTQGTLVSKYVHWAYIAININARAVAKSKLRVYAVKGVGQAPAGKRLGYDISKRVCSKAEVMRLKALPQFSKVMAIQQAEEIEELFEHPLVKLLYQINPNHNQFEMMELAGIYLDLTGDAYWLIESEDVMGEDRPAALWPIPSQKVRIIPDASGMGVLHYEIGAGKGKVTVEPQHMIHFRYANPFNPYMHGLAPLHAHNAMSVDRYTHYDQYEDGLVLNNGMPDYFVKYEGSLTDTQRTDLERSWNAFSHGTRMSQRVKVGDGAFDIKEMGFSPKEISYLSGRQWTRQEICGIFDVPMSMVTTDDINKANAEAGRAQHAESAVLPRLTRIEQTLNQDLVPMYDEPRLFVAYDDPVPANKVLSLKQQESDLKNYVITVNEVRAARGQEPVSWGHLPIARNNVAPLGTQAPPAMLGMRGLDGVPLLLTKAADEEDIDRERTGGANAAPDTPEKRLRAVVRSVWAKMLKDVTGQLDSRAQPEKRFELKVAQQMVFDFEPYAKELAELSQPILSDVLVASGDGALAAMGVSVPEWVEAPTVQTAIRDTSFKFAEKISKSVSDDLQKALSEGVLEGETTRQLKTRMTGVFEGYEQRDRALQIARTETSRVFNAGKEIAWSQTDAVVGKVWDALGDACPYCAPLDGQVVQLGEPFNDPVNGEPLVEGTAYTVPFKDAEGEPTTITMNLNYATIDAPPLHPNCRCTLRPEIIEL